MTDGFYLALGLVSLIGVAYVLALLDSWYGRFLNKRQERKKNVSG